MAVRINELTKDTSFNNDDYIMKDGSTNGTRLISVQNAADDLARKSTVGLRRPTAYDEATDVAGTDYIVKDDASAPKRVTAQNAATSFAQLAQYDTAESVSDQDYILKLGSTGVTKVGAERAAADFAQLAGQVVGSEMVESAIAKGLADEALDQAINTVMPNTVAQLRTELSEGTAATEIVDGAIAASELQSTAVESTDQFIKWDPANEEFKRVTAQNILKGTIDDAGIKTSAIDRSDQLLLWYPTAKEYKRAAINNVIEGYINNNAPQDYTITSGSTEGIYNANDTIRVVVVRDGRLWRYRGRDFLNELFTRTDLDSSYSSSGIPTNDVYLLQVYNYSDGKYVRRIGKLDTYKEIANYVGEHIPFNTNAAADTVDGQLTKALTDLGILNDVVDPDPT